MNVRSRWTCLAVLFVVGGVLAMGVIVPGCSPTKEEPAEEEAAGKPSVDPGEQPATGPDQGVVAEPAEEPTEEPTGGPPTEPTEEPSMEPAVDPTAEPTVEPAAPPTDEPPTDEPAADVQVQTSPDAKVSEYAPVEHLVGKVDYYVGRLEGAIKTEEDYEDGKGGMAKDSNTLVVIALGLGLHDQDNQYKASAGALMKAAQQVAAAEDFASAKAAVAELKAAADAQEATAVELKWEEKVASMPELMKQVPLIHNRLKRYVKRNRVEESSGFVAEIAVIAQASVANSGDTDQPNEVEEWVKYCLQMRGAAAAVGAAVRAGDKDATQAAMEQLNQSCDDCHAVFHPEEEPVGEATP